MTITPESPLVGQTIQDARIREKAGRIVLAIQRRGEAEMRFNPTHQERLQENDTFIVLGETECIQTLKRIIAGSATRSTGFGNGIACTALKKCS